MAESNSARIIREARQTKSYLAITNAELDFLAKHPHLNGNDRFLWTQMAARSAPDKDYSCVMTQEQIAVMAGLSLSVARKSIHTLRQHGFLETISTLGGPLRYFLTLPKAGLESISATNNRKLVDALSVKNSYPSLESGVPPVQNERPPRPIQTTPPSKMNDIYNIYNNINNIKHNHDAHSDFSPVDNPVPETDVLDADALICDFKILIQEKYQHLPVYKRAAAALSDFTDAQQKAINQRQLELAAISDGQKIQAELAQAQRFNEKLAEAKSVPPARTNNPEVKLVEFEFEGEYFLVEESVKNQILSQIPNLYNQNKILGTARQKSLKSLLSEIFYYVAKAGSKVLDACQLKRFYTARKLCLKGAWERPNGLEKQASIQREQQWQQAKIIENQFAKEFMQKVA